jgi:hypothetical protein
MKSLLISASLSLLLIPAAVLADSALDGTWKYVPQSYTQKQPDVFVLKDGEFDCRTCNIKFKVKADGQDQPVSGSPYYDTVSVSVVDAHTVQETRKKAGKSVVTVKFTTTDDGKTMTVEFSDSTASAEPVTGSSAYSLAAKGPAGSAFPSGTWRFTKAISFSDNGGTITYKTDGDMLSMTNPLGQSFNIKLDGSDGAYTGDPGQDTIAIKKVSAHEFRETDKLAGKVIGASTMKISADGKTMKIDWADKLNNTSGHSTLAKQ